MPAQCSLSGVCFSQLVFHRKGSFFLSWIYLEARPEGSVCHSFLLFIWHVPLQDFIPVANQWLQSGVWPQDREKENESILLKNTTAVEVDIPQKKRADLCPLMFPLSVTVDGNCTCPWYSHRWVVRPSEFLQAPEAAWTCWTRDSGPGTGILA